MSLRDTPFLRLYHLQKRDWLDIWIVRPKDARPEAPKR